MIYLNRMILHGLANFKDYFLHVCRRFCHKISFLILFPSVLLTLSHNFVTPKPSVYTDVKLYWPIYTSGHAVCAVVWGTALQAGRSRVRFPMVSLEFFIDIILPAALWPWGDSAFNRNEHQGYFLGVKAGGVIVLKYGSLNLLEPSGPVQACNGIALPLPLSIYPSGEFSFPL